jgi:hypothetical protein
MTPACMDFVRRMLTAEDVRDKVVLEVGSYDVNGSPRTVIEPLEPAIYVGIDIRRGPSVDVKGSAAGLLDAGRLKPFGFDLVVSTEMLEHAKSWRKELLAMKTLVRYGGALLITTRSPGFPRHDYPADYWRFTPDIMRAALADFAIVTIEDDPDDPGVFAFVRRPATWVDLSLIKAEPAPPEEDEPQP